MTVALSYNAFLASKVVTHSCTGLSVSPDDINPMLFGFQRDLTSWAIRKGRAAIFADTGLGKTFMQLEWARLIGQKTLIVAPLSVARQTVREGKKIGLTVTYVHNQSEVVGDISITNYERIRDFDFNMFGAVVLDESSILKAIGGKTRKALTRLCTNIPYRLCCTATPAPNDYTELGNHVEFLGICKASEMLAMFFINANKQHTYEINGINYQKKGSNKGGQEWRLKHHAEAKFFRWLSSWAIALTKPSDLGYSDDGFILPKLTVHPIFIEAKCKPPDGQLFFTHIAGIKHAAQIRRDTIHARLVALKELVNQNPNEQWIVWCGLNDESKVVTEALPDAIEVRGNDTAEFKTKAFEDFQDGQYHVLVTKPRIGGFGMNFQNAHKMAFFGLNYSWEAFYQCIRREWRYMQSSPVDVYIIMSDIEMAIYHNIMRKDAMASRLRKQLIEQARIYEKGELAMTTIDESVYVENTVKGENWLAMLGDSCIRLGEIKDDSIDLSIYSPPFADLYVYTDTERDLGNSRDWDEFFSHYAYIIRDMIRVTKNGRLTCVHSSDIPAMAQKDGYIGVKDFPGRVIAAHQKEGWIFVGRAFVQKNPQAQAIRTKSKALLFVQLNKDSVSSRPALVDQILLFRKPGQNAIPVTPVANQELDNERWIEWASGIWTGIAETNTLQYSKARGIDDEKHICPLQLETIERCIKLYSNPGETVLTPFGGIGSEGYMAVKLGRRATLIELKPEYFEVLVKNMNAIEAETTLPDLFTWAQEQADVNKGRQPSHEQ